MNFIERFFPVFRTGTHTDASGRVRTWTPADLDRMVSAYNPALHEAPVVIGHPSDNSPAFGWVRGLSREDDTLVARADLLPEFDDMVKKGLFRKRSISVYEDGTLRHIGFLGAMPPAIKGLPDIQFHEGEMTTIEFENNSKERGHPSKERGHPSENREARGVSPQQLNARGVSPQQFKGGARMKFMEWIKQMAGKEGITLEDLPRSFSEDDIKKQVEVKVEEEKKRLEVQFSEAGKEKEKDLAAREERIRVKETEARNAGIVSFCDAMQKEGTLTPAMMKTGMGMVNFLESISHIETPIEFGEEGKEIKQTPLEFMQSFLRGLPKAIEFREVATTEKDVSPANNAEKREKLVARYMEQNRKASYREAVLAVSMEHPALFEER